MRTFFKNYPKKIEFSKWPDIIDGLPEKLEKANIILITHSHKDHCKRVTVDRLKHQDTFVVAPKRCIKELGRDIEIIASNEEKKFKDVKIKAVEAYNTIQGSSTRKIHHKGYGVGYMINIDGKTIYHAGDTDLIPEMRKLGQIDVALLPIGGTFTMNLEEAVKAAQAIKPKIVIPMHNYRVDPQEFKDKLESKSNIETVLLKIGVYSSVNRSISPNL